MEDLIEAQVFEIINGLSKCALCKKEIVESEVLTFVDEVGTLRVAHKECFECKYKGVE